METKRIHNVLFLLGKVTDIKVIMALGVMMTPALAVDGGVKVSGNVPSSEELERILAAP
jgi:predicted DsbA family dithiol-disulfide isomerase